MIIHYLSDLSGICNTWCWDRCKDSCHRGVGLVGSCILSKSEYFNGNRSTGAPRPQRFQFLHLPISSLVEILGIYSCTDERQNIPLSILKLLFEFFIELVFKSSKLESHWKLHLEPKMTCLPTPYCLSGVGVVLGVEAAVWSGMDDGKSSSPGHRRLCLACDRSRSELDGEVEVEVEVRRVYM